MKETTITATGATDLLPEKSELANTKEKKHFPYDEEKTPTSSMNFGARLAVEQTTYYNDYLLADIAEGKPALASISLPEAAKLKDDSKALHKQYSKLLNTFANSVRNFQNSQQQTKDYSKAARGDSDATARLMEAWEKQFNNDIYSLKAIQHNEEKDIKALFARKEFKYTDKNGDTQTISSKESDDFYLRVVLPDMQYHHCQQQQLLVNLYNNRKKNLEKNTYGQAVRIARATTLHNLRFPHDKINLSDPAQTIDFKHNFLQQHQAALQKALETKGVYNLKVTSTMIRKMGGSAKKEQFGDIKLTPSEGGHGYTMSMLMHPKWGSKERIAMFKIMTTEAQTLGLQTFDLSDCAGFSNQEVIEFIKEIRRQYGQTATIIGEDFFIARSTLPEDKQLSDPNVQNALYQEFIAKNPDIKADGCCVFPNDQADIPLPKHLEEVKERKQTISSEDEADKENRKGQIPQETAHQSANKNNMVEKKTYLPKTLTARMVTKNNEKTQQNTPNSLKP